MCSVRRGKLSRGLTLLFVVAGIAAQHVRADESPASKQVARTEEGRGDESNSEKQRAFAKLLRRYCFECHDADTQEGNVRLDTIELTREHPRAGESLGKILDVVQSGKMPPEGAETPTAHERALLVSALEERLSELAEEARRSGRWTRNRRLTVEEYDFTMQTLFGVDADFADLLPADQVSELGYRNDSERLGLSSLQVESYLDSARRAVQRYLQLGEIDEQPLRYHIELEELWYSTAQRYETRKRAPRPIDSVTLDARRAANRASTPTYVEALGPTLPGAWSDDEQMRAAIPKLHQQYVAIPRRLAMGELIVRVRAAGTADRDGRFPRMRVEAGITLGDGCSMNKRVLGEIDVSAPLDDPRMYEFRIRLEDVPTKGVLTDEDAFDQLSVFDMDQIFISNASCDRNAIFALGRGAYSDPATGSDRIADQLKQMADDRVSFLHLDCLEMEMLPGVAAGNETYRWQVPSHEDDAGVQEELAIAREFLEQFMRHAFRRPIAGNELDTKLALFNTLRGRQYTFEQSLQETLVAVLISPSFLFLESSLPTNGADQQERPVTPHGVAARLSYLIWLSPPDAPLMACADDGSLMQQRVLRREAERLLADPRSRRFLESFCRQWLRLDKHANVAISRQAHPTWDDDLADASVRETLAYFVEVFRANASALDLIDSDYAMLNDRLAEHYDVDNVTTGDLHRVQLPESSIRGGLLTQASLMTMNSDGVDSHPIRRGVWLLERVLNDPPPPPPPNVPGIDDTDPDFRGLSLKERIELHREPGACKNCHEKIDPWGIAFENLDAIGRWRDKVEVRDAGELGWRPVDAAAPLPGGPRIGGIVELKRYLREQRAEQFANALVHHMLTYAIGRPPDYADRGQVQKIQDRFAASRYRLKELMLAIVESQLFRQ